MIVILKDVKRFKVKYAKNAELLLSKTPEETFECIIVQGYPYINAGAEVQEQFMVKEHFCTINEGSLEKIIERAKGILPNCFPVLKEYSTVTIEEIEK